MRRTQQRVSRLAFTLSELLVVIAIIAVLMTISVVAITQFMGSQQGATTKLTLTRLNSQLQKVLTKVNDEAAQSSVSPATLTLAASDAARAKILWKKLKWKQRLPQRFAEVFNPENPKNQSATSWTYLPPHKPYVDYLRKFNITPAASPLPVLPPPADFESAACLYMILRLSPDGGADDTGLTAATKTINGIPCFVDAWGNPLTFCRWPMGHQTPPNPTGISPRNRAGYQQGFNDPSDPQGLLCAFGWLTAPATTSTFPGLLHPLPLRASASAPAQTLNLTPVILSWGPDEQLGLDPNTLEILGSQEVDNLYAFENN
jgi:prepilin-type N-terminal cleavage/methylation domain-containing protein